MYFHGPCGPLQMRDQEWDLPTSCCQLVPDSWQQELSLLPLPLLAVPFPKCEATVKLPYTPQESSPHLHRCSQTPGS